MPLKPIFDKAPLTALPCQPLRAGLVRNESPLLKQLYALAANDVRPAMLDGAFRLACIVTARPMEEPAALHIRALLDAQKPDGAFALSAADSIALLRAAWALYEYEARKPILEHIAKWCGWFAQHTAEVLADKAVWTAPADLMELLENMYRVTGKAALLTLCERVSSQTMVWSSVLNTVSIQRPTCRSSSAAEIQVGMAQENDVRDGFYNQLYRSHHAGMLADGARSAMMKGWYSGSATELNAAKNGWERLVRYHGAICGGLTSDELLEGASPSMAVSTAALGAWAEALCTAAMSDHAAWAWEALERMAMNAMPACLPEGTLLTTQRVNTLVENPAEKDCFLLGDDLKDRALIRLVRGYAALCSSAVTARANGLDVNLYMPGRYAVPVGDQLLMLSLSRTECGYAVALHCKQDVRAAVRLRLPAWSRNTEIAVNGNDAVAGESSSAETMTIDRTWHDGDVLTIRLEKSLRMVDGHHQGKYLLCGPVLMALPVGEDASWAQALLGATEEDGAVQARMDFVKEWHARGDVPADVPVLPAPSGDAPTFRRLFPYAECPARIALFPRGREA